MMERREFIALVGGAAAVYPLAVWAQQPSMPAIGFLSASPPTPSTLEAFRKGLGDAGYVEGRNVSIEIRETDRYENLPALVAGFVRSRVAVIFSNINANAAQAAKAAAATTPVVFTVGSDPVKLGLVASMNRPGGNITGVSFYAGELAPKRLELLRELVPQASTIAVLVNPTNVMSQEDVASMREAARSVGQRIVVLHASSANEIDRVVADAAGQGVGGLLVNPDVFLGSRHRQIVSLAARYRIPACYYNSNYTLAGGLMSYSDDRFESVRQAGIYVARILKGERAASLPVLQPTKFELVINLKTAKALGITFPPSFHLRADEVIE
jgi:putative ABC transport system substrate-binding protein